MPFPTSLDTFAYPNSSQKMNDPAVLSTVIVADLNNAATALEEKVGIDWSADTTSLDYKTTRLTAKWDIQTHDWTNYIKKAVWPDWYMLVADSTKPTWLDYIAPTSWGTVTTASVVSANWFAWSVATATTTPAITLSTTVTGLLKGNGTAISAATAWTDYTTPTGSQGLSNKTITTSTWTGWTITSPTIVTPTVNVGSDANGDLYYRAGWTLARLAVGTTNDFLTVSSGAPVWTNPFMYEGTLTIPTATSNGWGVQASTHYQMTAMSVWMVTLTRGTSGYAKVRYSPDNATWTDIVNINTAWSNTFPLFLKKWFYYYVEVDSPVWGSASTASITALF